MTLFSQVLPATPRTILSPSLVSTLRTVSVSVAALLLCLLALGQPARSAIIITYIDTNETISTPFNYHYVQVMNSATVNLVSGGSISGNLEVFGGSTVNVSGGSIGTLGLIGPYGFLNVVGTGLSLSEPTIDEYVDSWGDRIVAPFVVLTGTLADGTPINTRVYLVYGADVSQITLSEPDPFPALRAQVVALGTAGTLSAGNTNALLVKLDAAQTALATGDTAAGRETLTAFINQVTALVRAGKLTQAQATPLLAAAQDILDSLG